MSASLEYTEWHLTPTGWIRGTTKTDSTYKSSVRPLTALATFIYSEEISYFGPADEKVAESWLKGGAASECDAAITLHGECPRHL